MGNKGRNNRVGESVGVRNRGGGHEKWLIWVIGKETAGRTLTSCSKAGDVRSLLDVKSAWLNMAYGLSAMAQCTIREDEAKCVTFEPHTRAGRESELLVQQKLLLLYNHSLVQTEMHSSTFSRQGKCWLRNMTGVLLEVDSNDLAEYAR
eukprot:1470531-Pleurochrysis_carterae.AAC.1